MSIEDIVKKSLEQIKKKNKGEESPIYPSRGGIGIYSGRSIGSRGTIYLDEPKKDIQVTPENIEIAKNLLELLLIKNKAYSSQDEKKVAQIMKQVRDIGQNLWNNGGEPRMSDIVDIIRMMEREKYAHTGNRKFIGCARVCEMDWDGIGTWLG